MALTITIDFDKEESKYEEDLKEVDHLLSRSKCFRMFKIIFQDEITMVYDLSHGGKKEKYDADRAKAIDIRVKIMTLAKDRNYQYVSRKYKGDTPKPYYKRIEDVNQTDENLVDNANNREIMDILKENCRGKKIDIKMVEQVAYNPYKYTYIILQKILGKIYDYYKKSVRDKPINEAGFSQRWCDKIMEDCLVCIPYPLLLTNGLINCPDQISCKDCQSLIRDVHIFTQALKSKKHYDNLAVKFLHDHPKAKKEFLFSSYFENLEFEHMKEEFRQRLPEPEKTFKELIKFMKEHECEEKCMEKSVGWANHRSLNEAGEDNQKYLNQVFENKIVEETRITTQEKIMEMRGWLREAYGFVVKSEEKEKRQGSGQQDVAQAVRKEVSVILKEFQDYRKTNDETLERMERLLEINNFKTHYMAQQHMLKMAWMDEIAGKGEAAIAQINSHYDRVVKEQNNHDHTIRGMWLKFQKEQLSEKDKEMMRTALFDEPDESFHKYFEQKRELMEEARNDMKKTKEQFIKFNEYLKEVNEQIKDFSNERQQFLQEKDAPQGMLDILEKVPSQEKEVGEIEETNEAIANEINQGASGSSSSSKKRKCNQETKSNKKKKSAEEPNEKN